MLQNAGTSNFKRREGKQAAQSRVLTISLKNIDKKNPKKEMGLFQATAAPSKGKQERLYA